MNELVIMHDKQAVTSSLRVAEVFGKDHKHVLETINNLAAEKSAAKFFSEGTYENRGKEYPMYYMTRDGFTLLAMGFTGKEALKFKIQYIQAFDSMEATLKRLPVRKLDPVQQAQLAITREQTKRANALYRIALHTDSKSSQQTLLALAAKELTGEMTIPVLKQKEYSAGEAAKKLGISSGQKVGKIANKLGIKAEQPGQNEYGRWTNSKSRYSNKEVPQWVYFDKGVQAIKAELKEASK
ncbi:Rha family transcriptional regulator [Schleiferilactobacillus perolens]|jgi:Rha family phage regulatory protein|uniref:Rha family transcriptional regulator n=1 Tax=Schleiferilactobacillus perolens TaxID=100468 RepID=UPI00235430E7|nr:Rha family transcriptional regulator [Schleiferilactobacillus perolens]MCI2172022.1 Rha family transcriptional regulator [Schleiferilactobacillus perolens]